MPETSEPHDAPSTKAVDDASDEHFSPAEDPKLEDAKLDDAKLDDAKLDDATPDDATPDDATPDDATPDDATPDEINPDAMSELGALDSPDLDDVRLEAHDVAVRRRHVWLLPPTSLEVVPGEVTLAVGEPDERHTFLALAMAGRLSGHEGDVRIAGALAPRRLQREVALVDLVGVTAPEPVLRVRAVVGEELAMSGRKAWPRNVADWLEASQLPVNGMDRLGDIDPGARVALLTELALMRQPRFVVLALPERHGALPDGWWQVAHSAARRGAGVLVTASPTAAAHLTDAHRVTTIGPAGTPARVAQDADHTEATA